MNARSMQFLSSRTLPGQLCCFRVMRECGVNCLWVPACAFSSPRKCSASRSTSLPRLRSGGSSIGNTARRYSRSSRSWPLCTACSGQRLVAAITRTSVDELQARAHPVELAGLEHAQEARLHVERHLRHLVEQQRPALGAFEHPCVPAHRAREAALLVAEQLGLDQPGGDRTAVDREERAAAAQAPVMDRLRRELFPGTALAGQQHARLGRAHPLDQAEYFLHGGRDAQDRAARRHAEESLGAKRS